VIAPFGEAALLVETGTPERGQALAARLRAEPVAGVEALVPGLSTVLVELDSLGADTAAIRTHLAEHLERLTETAPAGRRRTIPVVYGGEAGPDLASVAELCGLSEAEVIDLHSAAELRVLFDGFAPGFAYLGNLPDELRVPRLDTPRTRTPVGSVGIAGPMSGIYPAALPGGWRIVGRTPIALFDPRRDPPAYLVPGDVVRFEPIAAGEWEARAGAPDDWAA
jgi:KipI family sensor histidine kinase inhibitor